MKTLKLFMAINLPNGSAHTIKYSLKHNYLYSCGFEKNVVVWKIDSYHFLSLKGPFRLLIGSKDYSILS